MSLGNYGRRKSQSVDRVTSLEKDGVSPRGIPWETDSEKGIGLQEVYWGVVEEQPLEESKGSEGRLREKLGWDAASIAASAGPPGKLWGRVALRSTPDWSTAARSVFQGNNSFQNSFFPFQLSGTTLFQMFSTIAPQSPCNIEQTFKYWLFIC